MTGTVIIFYTVLTEIDHNCRHSADFINLNKDCFFLLFLYVTVYSCNGALSFSSCLPLLMYGSYGWCSIQYSVTFS